MNTTPDFILGTWTYRSFISNPDVDADFNALQFGVGNMRFDAAPMNALSGLLYGDGWQLALTGATNYGNPVTLRFQGKGVVNGEQWIYDYEGYVIKPWPNGIAQVPAIVGTIVRTIPHSNSNGGLNPAGVVAQWIAVKQG